MNSKSYLSYTKFFPLNYLPLSQHLSEHLALNLSLISFPLLNHVVVAKRSHFILLEYDP